MLKQSIELNQSVADKCKDKVDSSMQDIEGGEEEENDDDGDECYNMSVSRLLSSCKNRGRFSGHHNHSSSSDRKRRTITIVFTNIIDIL